MNEELKPLGRTLQRIDRCPGKVATPGTECCVATGRPALRSVHRESNCLVMEPRNQIRRGSVRCVVRRAQYRHVVRPEREGPTGVKERSGCSCEVRQEPGRSCVSVEVSGGSPMIRPRSTRAVLVRDGSEQERNDGNRRAKATKRGPERATGSRSSSWYRRSRGTNPTGPGGGTERAGTRNCWRAR